MTTHLGLTLKKNLIPTTQKTKNDRASSVDHYMSSQRTNRICPSEKTAIKGKRSSPLSPFSGAEQNCGKKKP